MLCLMTRHIQTLCLTVFKISLVSVNNVYIKYLSLAYAVFDDGDMTTLRRTSLSLNSGGHLATSESRDQLTLSHSESFGSTVVGASAHPTMGLQQHNKLAQNKTRCDYYFSVVCLNKHHVCQLHVVQSPIPPIPHTLRWLRS